MNNFMLFSACTDPCASCTGPNTDDCTACNDISLYLDESTCVAACPVGKFANINSQKCEGN